MRDKTFSKCSVSVCGLSALNFPPLIQADGGDSGDGGVGGDEKEKIIPIEKILKLA